MSRAGLPGLLDVKTEGLRVGVVAALWHERIVDGLLAGAYRALAEAGVTSPTVVRVPGAFELPVAAAALADSGYDAVIALGAVVRGGTPHFDYVCQAATIGLTSVATERGVPIGFGLLTCDDEQQALARAGLPGSVEDKGYDSARAALATAVTLRTIRAPRPPDGPGVAPKAYRSACGRFTTGVVLLTSRIDGLDLAITANSFTSVSLEPPLVLACVQHDVPFRRALLAHQRWGVSVLAETHEDVSRWFADPQNRLNGLGSHSFTRGPKSSAALLEAALAVFECHTVAVYGAGDHTIVVGAVLSADVTDPSAKPLAFLDGTYVGVTALEQSARSPISC